MQLDGFDGRVALVTGGAGGIGATIATTLRDLGAHVAVGDIAKANHEGILGVTLDVSSEESVRAAVATVVQEARPSDDSGAQRRSLPYRVSGGDHVRKLPAHHGHQRERSLPLCTGGAAPHAPSDLRKDPHPRLKRRHHWR